MTTDDDIRVLICARVTFDLVPWPGSVVRECADCDSRVWLAPDLPPPLQDRSFLILCVRCALIRWEAEHG